MSNTFTPSTTKHQSTMPLGTKAGMREPTVLNGKKVAPKVRNKPTYSNTLNNYEDIRNLVTFGSAKTEAPETISGGKKHVSISV